MSDDAPLIRDRVLSALSAAEVRVLHVSGEPWFPVNDLVAALGVNRRTLDYHVGHLPDHDKRHLPRPSRLPRDINVGHAGLNCVSLAGLLKLLLRTNGDAATTFQDWVCRSILIPQWDAPQGA